MRECGASDSLTLPLDVNNHACETWPGVARTLVVSTAACVVAWHSPDVANRALIVFLCLGLPALARTAVAPVLAWLLRGVRPVNDDSDTLLSSQKLARPKATATSADPKA